MMRTISFQAGETQMDWLALVQALEAGHQKPKAEVKDLFLYRGKDTVLSRSAWIDGMGMLTKTATVFPDNPTHGKPMIGGGVLLFDDKDGTLAAVIDFHLITKWKTAGDSLLAALKLAPRDAKRILIVGAGTVGASLIDAFSAGFPDASFEVWNRTLAKAEALANAKGAVATQSLEQAVKRADIIVSATMTTEPIIHGEWLSSGQHLNMIGAYRPDMREADDKALQTGTIFVDSYDTTLDHIGELKIPLSTGAIGRDDVVADFYEMDRFQRQSGLTVFKNGGGAHLDLMTARYVLEAMG